MDTFQDGNDSGADVTYPVTDPSEVCRETSMISPRVGRDYVMRPDGEYAMIPPPPVDETDEVEDVVRSRADIEEGRWPNWYIDKHIGGVFGAEGTGLISEAVRRGYFVTCLDAEGNSYFVPQPLFDQVSGWHSWTAVAGTTARNYPPSSPYMRATFVRDLTRLARMDRPVDLGQACSGWLQGLGIYPAQSTGVNDFLINVPMVDNYLGDATDYALAEAFSVKYFYGRRRPHEVLGRWIEESPNVTPRHPSYPAGHGAAAGATYEELLALYGDGLDEVQRAFLHYTCLLFAHLRTFLGVHWASDNSAGFRIGRACAPMPIKARMDDAGA